MGWRLEPEPTMSRLKGSLIRKIGARNLLGTAAPERSTRQDHGNAHSQVHLRYRVLVIGVLIVLFFPIMARLSRLLSPCSMCLKFVVKLGIAMRISHPSVFVH